MTLTPVISSRDLAALRRQAVDDELKRLGGDAAARAEAAAALFARPFPDRPRPDTTEAVLAALEESEAVPPEASAGLASRRLDAVRALVANTGVEPSRLPASGRPVRRAEPDGVVEVELAVTPEREPPGRGPALGRPAG